MGNTQRRVFERGARLMVAAAALFASAGCARVPLPLAPAVMGSIGLPHRGVLTHAVSLPKQGDGFQLLRNNERSYGLPRFVHVLERAAERVSAQRPGGTLVIGDLSAQHGGPIMPHFSHRSGRDADLVFYATTLEGAPVASPGFLHYGADGLAWDDANRRFLRFDVEREWLLVKALVEDEQARVQWLFISRVAEAMLSEWAHARGEPVDTVVRAQEMMAQPHPGGAHDDHIHVRTACAPDDVAQGCEPSGPLRPWLTTASAEVSPASGDDIDAIVLALLRPIGDEPFEPGQDALPVSQRSAPRDAWPTSPTSSPDPATTSLPIASR